MSERAKEYLNKIDSILLGIGWTVVLFIYVYFALFLNTYLANSDSVFEMLLGREWIQSPRLFNNDIVFVADIFAYTPTTLLSAVWYAILGNMVTAHKVVLLCDLALISISFIYMVKGFGFDQKATALSLLLFFGVRSAASGGLIGLGSSIYASYHYVAFIAIGYAVRRLIGERNNWAMNVLLFIVAFWFGIITFRLLIVLFLPIFVISLWRVTKDKEFSFPVVSGIWLLANLAGMVINSKILPNLMQATHRAGIANLTIAPLEELYTNFGVGIKQFIMFTGLLPLHDSFSRRVALFSPLGVNVFVSLFFILGVIFFCIKNRDDIFSKETPGFSILFFSCISTATAALLCYPVVFAMRYLFLMFALMGIVPAREYVRDRARPLLPHFIIAISVIVVVTNCVSLHGRSILYAFRDWRLQEGDLVDDNRVFSPIGVHSWRDFSLNKRHEKVQKIAEEYGADTGYSLFWHHNVVNFLSNGRVNIAPLTLEFTPWMVNTKNSYFDARQQDQRSFFVCYEDVLEVLPPQSKAVLLNADRVVPIDSTGLNMYLFRINPFVKYGRFTGKSMVIYPSTRQMLKNGFTAKSTNSRTIVSDPTLEHNVLYGPYMVLPAGKYTVNVQYRVIDAPDEIVGTLSVTAESGNLTLAAPQPLQKENTSHQTEFLISTQKNDVEFVVWAGKECQIEIESLKIVRAENDSHVSN